MSAILRDERVFERHLIAGLAGGLAAGVISVGVEAALGQHIPAMGAMSFAALVGLAANLVDPREEAATLRLVLVLIGGALMALLMQASFLGAPLLGAALGGGFIGAGMTYLRPEPRWRFWAGLLVFAALLPAAIFTTETLFAGYFLPLQLPHIAQQALVGGIWGLFIVLAAGLSDLGFIDDPLPGRLRAAIKLHQDPVRDYLESALETYQRSSREWARAESPDTRQQAEQIAAEVVDSMLRFAARSQELRADVESSDASRLSRRLERLDRQMRQASTPEIAAQIEEARAEVRAQIELRERLKLACARLESQLQRGATTLEKLHLTLTQHAASRVDTAALDAALHDLQYLADQAHFKNLSVEELCELDGFDELVFSDSATHTVKQSVEAQTTR